MRYIPGQWNVICDRCGFQFKSRELRPEWTGRRVCRGCYEPRHPLDLLRSQVDRQTPPWVRPETPITDSSFVYHYPTQVLFNIGGQISYVGQLFSVTTVSPPPSTPVSLNSGTINYSGQSFEAFGTYFDTFTGTGDLGDHTADSGHTYTTRTTGSTISGGVLVGTGLNAVGTPIGTTTYGKTYTATVGSVVTDCNFRLARSSTVSTYPVDSIDSFYELYILGTIGEYRLTKYVGGVTTQLIQTANTIGAGDVYAWHISSTGFHTITKNGSPLGTYDDSSAPLDGRYIGIRMLTDATSGLTELRYG